MLFRKKISVKLFDNFTAVFCFLLLKFFEVPNFSIFKGKSRFSFFLRQKNIFLLFVA